MPYTPNTVHKLSDDDAFRYRMHSPDEDKLLADDLAFLQAQQQPCPLNKQLQQMYVDVKVDICYDPFSLMESVYAQEADDALTLVTVAEKDATFTDSTSCDRASIASLAFEKVRNAICDRSMMFDEDADMPAELRAF